MYIHNALSTYIIFKLFLFRFEYKYVLIKHSFDFWFEKNKKSRFIGGIIDFHSIKRINLIWFAWIEIFLLILIMRCLGSPITSRQDLPRRPTYII